MIKLVSFYFKASKYGKKTLIVFKINKPQGIGVFNKQLTLKILTVDQIHVAQVFIVQILRWVF